MYHYSEENPFCEERVNRDHKEVIVTLEGVTKNEWGEESLVVLVSPPVKYFLPEGAKEVLSHYEVSLLRNGATIKRDRGETRYHIRLP
jgi:hypothetical protein